MHNNNRYRVNSQLTKAEKGNENLELRKRLQSVTKDKHLRGESVWDRLSKVRKSPSLQNMAITRPNLSNKPSQRIQIVKQMPTSQQQHTISYHQQMQQQQQKQPESPRRPLTPNSGRRVSRQYRLQKPIIFREIDNQEFLPTCKPIKSLNEILTARSLNNSKSSSEEVKPNFNQPCARANTALHSLNQQTIVTASDKTWGGNSEDSADEYKLAPLMSTRVHCNRNSSTNILHNFDEVLQNRRESPNEMELVKNVIKCDERYPQLDKNNPELFKDILKTQLQDILKHEYVVKQALDKLESTHSLQACHHEMQAMQSDEEIVAYERPQKLEIDVVFKNVPSLEKEIIILRALGERLEATLNRTTAQRSLHVKSRESNDLNTPTENGKLFMMVKAKSQSFILALEHCAHSCLISRGLICVSGVAQEFRMAQKTIVELKAEESRQFYIPIFPETAELKKTSFKILKESPDLLMRHIKATNSTVPFNVLDHDPIFFNNILFNNKGVNTFKASVASSTVELNKNHKERSSQPVLCEAGDSRQFDRKSPEKLLTYENVTNGKENSTAFMQPIVRGKERRRIRRSLTPFSADKTHVNTKNALFKTILVGTVQISCFMLLIMAFTFPEAKC